MGIKVINPPAQPKRKLLSLLQDMEDANFYTKKEILRIISIFIITYVILCIFVILFPYEIKDPDSGVYSQISRELAYIPIREWCAPLWQGHDNDPLNPELFQDHPPGMFWVIALFIRAGVPAQSAALCVNFLFMSLSLFFLYRLVSFFGGPFLGWGVVYGYIFTPIFLLYLTRANQEHPINLAVIAGLYAYIRSDESWRYKALFAVSLVFAVFIKGIIVFILIMFALFYWFFFIKKPRSIIIIVFSILFMLSSMYLFELWHLKITYGVSFWKNYILFQGGSAIQAGFKPLYKIYNFIWYTSRALFFPAPWIFFVPYGIYKSFKSDRLLIRNKFFKFILFCSVFIIMFFSFFDRKADRYIFSSYCLLVISGIWALLYLKPWLTQYLKKRKKILPLCLSLALIIFTLLRIYFHTYHYRHINFWTG